MRHRPGRFTTLPPHIPSPRSNSRTLRAIHIHPNQYGETFSSLIVSNTLRSELFRESSPLRQYTELYTFARVGRPEALSSGPATSLATFHRGWTASTVGRKCSTDG